MEVEGVGNYETNPVPGVQGMEVDRHLLLETVEGLFQSSYESTKAEVLS